MNHTVLRSEKERNEWVSERRCRDIDFDPDISCYGLPVTVWWVDIETNGWPHIAYDAVSGDVFEMVRMFPKLVETLEFYGQMGMVSPSTDDEIIADCGDKARAAIAETKSN